MNHEDNPKSIKYHVKKFFLKEGDRFKGKIIVDFPAGNGITSKIIREIGAKPIPFDLFPEYFKVDGLACRRANIKDGIPLESKSVDALICQEGIEHFSDQASALKEFNRIIKMGGSLIITTPNYSNLRSRLSYFLSESERTPSFMPPNELDSIWMSNQDITTEIYYGHIFLIGIQKLRCLAKLAGFKIKNIQFTRAKLSSLLLLFLSYPFILMFNWIAYKKSFEMNKDFGKVIKKLVYNESFRLAINPKILIDGHLFVEFEKEHEIKEVALSLKGKHKEFGST
ncbi:MAG TPA: class I SAM-dependent methyltransferase [Flavobacteriales bacterium]|nr:class I SAM-dependent methyltransferase [Flavobacteriales bacterium]HIN40387.1 class I SAM-dependent methyltransferase [Flavobacteriales bacterium]